MELLPRLLKKQIFPEKEEKPKEKELQFKVGVTSGIYGVARGEEIATFIRKLGYALTRGTSVVELASDVPHEVDYSTGREVRYIAEKQGLDVSFHGSLTVSMCIPERIEWGIAQDHMQKSIKSAVFAGAKYLDFHASLREWLELFTYAGARLDIVMCDPEGRLIRKILYENPKLRKWFVETERYRFAEKYANIILGSDRVNTVFVRARSEIFKEKADEIRDMNRKIINEIYQKRIKEIEKSDYPPDEKQRLIEQAGREREFELRRLENTPDETLVKHTPEISEDINKRFRKLIKKEVEDYLASGEAWYQEERTGTLQDAYVIIAHHLFFKKDPPDAIWEDMVKLYEKCLVEKLGFDEKDDTWLERTLKGIEDNPDKELVREFKEFYYGVVGAKFLEGHIVALVEWMEEQLPEVIEAEIRIAEKNEEIIKKEKEKLKKILDELCIAIENPDSRNPEHGGRYILWRPKQIYIAIKHIRNRLKKEGRDHRDKVFMLVDFEHLATQGVDAYEELKELSTNEMTKEAGKLVKTVHSGYPSPLHSHKPIEPGDRELIYRLLWLLREMGLGQEHMTYIIFERGGFKDPFADSVSALKIMVKYLKKGVPSEELPPEFFEIPSSLQEARQEVIIFEHTFDPIKGLLKHPEEEYTLLSAAAIAAGKKPEEWKKEELK